MAWCVGLPEAAEHPCSSPAVPALPQPLSWPGFLKAREVQRGQNTFLSCPGPHVQSRRPAAAPVKSRALGNISDGGKIRL